MVIVIAFDRSLFLRLGITNQPVKSEDLSLLSPLPGMLCSHIPKPLKTLFQFSFLWANLCRTYSLPLSFQLTHASSNQPAQDKIESYVHTHIIDLINSIISTTKGLKEERIGLIACSHPNTIAMISIIHR